MLLEYIFLQKNPIYPFKHILVIISHSAFSEQFSIAQCTTKLACLSTIKLNVHRQILLIIKS